MAEKIRLDHLLLQRGLAETRSQAQALVLAGEVLVGGQVAHKPGTMVRADSVVDVRGRLPYVSRGGLKLAAALDAFQVQVTGRTCADVGASTGGFTDCLLQRGAARVYAIDVGYGQLAWKLRQDERVVVMERTNVRHLESLPDLVHIVTVDVSFISLNLVLPAIVRWMVPGADIIPLVKPQFEVQRKQVGKGGVVRDRAVHRQVLEQVASYASKHGLAVHGVVRSPITGPAGNLEFLMVLRQSAPSHNFDLSAIITECLVDDD